MYDITNINIPLPSHTIYNKIIYQDFGVHQFKFLASASFPPESPCDHMQFPNDPASVGTSNINQDRLMSCRKYLLSFWHRSPCNNSSIISIIHEEKNTEINIFQRPLTWIFSLKKTELALETPIFPPEYHGFSLPPGAAEKLKGIKSCSL